MVCKPVPLFNKGITDLSKFIKGLSMYIGDNELNDHDGNFSKKKKKCFISNLFCPNYSDYTLAFQLHLQNLPLNIHASCL